MKFMVFKVTILFLLLPSLTFQNAKTITILGWRCKETTSDLTCSDSNKTEADLTRLKFKNKAYLKLEITNKNFPALSDLIFENTSVTLLILDSNELKIISNRSFISLNSVEFMSFRNNKLITINDLIDAAPAMDISTLTEINLESNLITKVDREFTSSFGSLASLRLGFNLIYFVCANAFTSLLGLRVLDLSDNRIKSFKGTTLGFIINSELETFNIENNNIGFIIDISNGMPIRVNEIRGSNANVDSIEPYSFVNFVTLRELDLSLNNVAVLRDFTFKNLSNLNFLSLKSNRVEVIEDRALADLYRLTNLNLEYNRIKLITSKVFSYLTSIRTIRLQSNRIESVQDNAGANLSRLFTLDVSYNTLTRITSRTFHGMFSLKYLSLTFNPIQSIDASAFVDNKECCAASQVDVTNDFPCSRFVFDLKQMRLTTLNDFTFTGLDEFRSCLNLDRNQIQSIGRYSFAGLSNMLELRLSNNLISSIESGAFSDLRRLNMLNLTGNLIFALNEDVFMSLNSLRSLFLTDNNVKELSARLLDSLTNLRVLSLERNEIRKVSSDTFESLKSLEELDLTGNKIEEIKLFYFKPLISLKKLCVDSNKIISVDAKSFILLKKLEIFSASFNPLSDLRSSAFKNITESVNLMSIGLVDINENFFYESKCKKLDLQHNSLVDIKDNSFLNMCSLTALYLSNNRIKNISLRYYNFNYTRLPITCETGLQHIYLSNNHLTSLSFVSNPHMKQMITLDLSYNQIEFVSTEDLRGLTGLRVLYMSNNMIRAFEQNSFGNSKLRHLDLQNQNFSSQFVFDMKDVSSNIQTLILSNNCLTNMKFRVLSELLTFKLSNIKIDSIFRVGFATMAKVNELDLSQNLIEFNSTFNELFSKLAGLRKLNFSRVGLKSLDSVSLRKTSATLNNLDLSFNLLESILCNQTDFLVYLRYIYLNNNRIMFIEHNAFSPLAALQVLNLEGNFLLSFSFDEFYIAGANSTWRSGLEKLNYQSNQIVSCETAFSSLKKIYFDNVTELDFSHNFIEHLELGRLFTESNKMERVYLDNNHIQTIPIGLFSVFRLLKTLNLESNRITTIESYSFFLQFLEVLNLANNSLVQLAPNTFAGLFQLRRLNLSSNVLEYLDALAFKDLYKLVDLDLSRNRIRLLHNFVFQNAVSLELLILLDNRLIQFYNRTFTGLISVKTILVDYDSLTDSNILSTVNSLKPVFYKSLLSRVYLKSINVLYLEEVINCSKTLTFIKFNLHLVLKTDKSEKNFMKVCRNFTLNFSSNL
jgi:Leucine-rich repeat (LRR) protein